MHEKAADDYVGFWRIAVAELEWQPSLTVPLDDSRAPNYRWFSDGQLNISQMLDVHLAAAGTRSPSFSKASRGTYRKLTYGELRQRGCAGTVWMQAAAG